jgi:hypothetical protein
MSPGPAPRSSYPIYYFYNGYVTASPTIQPDLWMNDVGEKIPNWFESARLYYAYTGDASVMTIAKGLVDYALAHGTSPSTFAWPNFPYTTTNAGDLEFRGFTESGRFALHEIQVDHAAEIGLTTTACTSTPGTPGTSPPHSTWPTCWRATRERGPQPSRSGRTAW